MTLQTAAIIQARMNSTRLPGKVMKPLAGHPLIHHIVARLKRSRLLDGIILATTTCKEDDELSLWAVNNGIPVFRGGESDVLGRYFQAATFFNVRTIVRITADDPFKDHRIMDDMLNIFQQQKLDLMTNNQPPSFPEGLDIEIFTFECLKLAAENATIPFEREHVTPYFYQNLSRFNWQNYSSPCDLSSMRWTIDDADDFNFVDEIYRRLYSENEIFSTDEILNELRTNRHLMDINKNSPRSHIYQGKLHE